VRSSHKEAVCIVDCGTAVTIDLMDKSGLHVGGLILPGITLMRNAVFDKTHIPRNEIMEPEGLWARDSHSAIASASLFAVVALVEKAVAESVAIIGDAPKLLLTGSDSSIVAHELRIPSSLIPDLVMQGLYCLSVGEG